MPNLFSLDCRRQENPSSSYKDEEVIVVANRWVISGCLINVNGNDIGWDFKFMCLRPWIIYDAICIIKINKIVKQKLHSIK